jgi:hypothetical protein
VVLAISLLCRCLRLLEPFDLRQQVGKLIIAKLAVFPADLDAGIVLGKHFPVCTIRGPDHHFVEFEGTGFKCFHQFRRFVGPAES